FGPDLLDRLLLRLQPVDVSLLLVEDALEKGAGAVVAGGAAGFDPLVEPLHGLVLDLKVELELLGDGLAYVDLAVPLHVRHALEVEAALDQLVGVLHLPDALLAHALVEALVAPVVAEAGVEEVLVD